MPQEPKPRAREGILTTDHSKRGRRFLTALDPERLVVTLLEPWEHEVLLLSDGSRDAAEIAELVSVGEREASLDGEAVARCLRFFERQGLIHPLGPGSSELPPPGPRTIAELRAAYQEWHKRPLGTGEIFPPTGRAPPGAEDRPAPDPRLAPTVVAHPSAARDAVPRAEKIEAAPGASGRGEEPGSINVLRAAEDAVREASLLDDERD